MIRKKFLLDCCQAFGCLGPEVGEGELSGAGGSRLGKICDLADQSIQLFLKLD
jgi:hypothetical protein